MSSTEKQPQFFSKPHPGDREAEWEGLSHDNTKDPNYTPSLAGGSKIVNDLLMDPASVRQTSSSVGDMETDLKVSWNR